MNRRSLPTAALVLAVALAGLSAAPITIQDGSSRTRPKPLSATIKNLHGAGSKTCETWTEEKGEPDGAVNTQWVMGYATAVFIEDAFRFAATNGTKELDPVTSEGIERFVDRYCADRPSRTVWEAARALMASLGHEWPMPKRVPREYR